jgi:hypothetical protein
MAAHMQNLKMPATSIRAVKIVKFFAASLAFSVLFGFLGIFSTPAIGADAYYRIIICLKFFIGTFACAPFLIVGILVLIVYGFRLIVCFLTPA